MKSWKATTTSMPEVSVTAYFNRNIICYSLSPEYENTSFTIEKSHNDLTISDNGLGNTVVFQSQFGVFSLSNSEQLMRALTGIDISSDMRVANNDNLALLCSKFPKGLTDILGRLSPGIVTSEPQNLYSAMFKVTSHDLLLTSEITGNIQFWENLIKDVKPTSLEPRQTQLVSDTDFRIPIGVGKTRLFSADLDRIEIGDVFLLDSRYVDKNAEGIISIEKVNLSFEIVICDSEVCLKVLEVK